MHHSFEQIIGPRIALHSGHLLLYSAMLELRPIHTSFASRTIEVAGAGVLQIFVLAAEMLTAGSRFIHRALHLIMNLLLNSATICSQEWDFAIYTLKYTLHADNKYEL